MLNIRHLDETKKVREKKINKELLAKKSATPLAKYCGSGAYETRTRDLLRDRQAF